MAAPGGALALPAPAPPPPVVVTVAAPLAARLLASIPTNDPLVQRTRFLPWTDHAAIGGAAAMSSIPAYVLLRHFIGRCTIGGLPADLAAAQVRSVLTGKARAKAKAKAKARAEAEAPMAVPTTSLRSTSREPWREAPRASSTLASSSCSPSSLPCQSSRHLSRAKRPGRSLCPRCFRLPTLSIRRAGSSWTTGGAARAGSTALQWASDSLASTSFLASLPRRFGPIQFEAACCCVVWWSSTAGSRPRRWGQREVLDLNFISK